MKKVNKLYAGLISTVIAFGSLAMPVYADEPVNDDIIACDVGDCNPTGTFRGTSSTYTGLAYGSFVVLASNVSGASSNGQTLSGTRSYTYSNSVTGAISGSQDAISATVGFSVTASQTLTASYAITLNKNQKGRISVRPIYEVYSVPYQRYWVGTVDCNFWKYAGTATVRRFVGYDYLPETWY